MHLTATEYEQIDNPLPTNCELSPEISKATHTIVDNPCFSVTSRLAYLNSYKKYSSDGGYFSKYQIDSVNAQLVIIAKDYMIEDGFGLGVNWNISGFNPYSGKITYKNYNFKSLADSIPIIVYSMKGGDSNQVIQRNFLYKIKTVK